MKKKLSVVIGIGLLVCGSLFAASNAEFTKGIDFTGVSSITPSMLNQLVDNAKPAAARGLIISTNGAPPVATFSYLTNYIWRDISYSPPTLKFYDGVTTSWVSALVGADSVVTGSITNGAVTTAKIADAAVNGTKIATNTVTALNVQSHTLDEGTLANSSVSTRVLIDGSVTADKITNGVITNIKIAGGGIVETNLAASIVTTPKIADGAVSLDKITNGVITGAKLAGGTVFGTNIAGNTITATNLNFVPMTNVVYTSVEIDVPVAGSGITNAHGLGSMPNLVRVVLVCKTGEYGYVAGDELDAANVAVYNFANAAFSISANGTDIMIQRSNDDYLLVPSRTTTLGAQVDLSEAKWKIKIYAWKL